jgi:hypothetical protein
MVGYRVYDLATWREAVEHGVYFDMDGYGVAFANGILVDEYVKPSDIDILSPDITHIQWYSRYEP